MGGFNNDPVITIGCGGRNKLPATALLLALLLALDKDVVDVVPIRGDGGGPPKDFNGVVTEEEAVLVAGDGAEEKDGLPPTAL